MTSLELKVLIADDEEGMRLVLKKALEKIDGIRVIGEAENGETALRLFEYARPSVVFMDVEMPGMNGLECAKKLMDINPMTFVIFVTAHEEYMPGAFDVYAFDYIVKPFKIERIRQTLARIMELGYRSDTALPEAKKREPAETGSLGKLMIKNREGISLVDMEDILLIQREERTTVIYTANERYTTSEGLSELEARLDSTLFFRSHKSYILNLSAISRIYPYGRWTYIIRLKGTDKDALLTHERYEELERLFL